MTEVARPNEIVSAGPGWIEDPATGYENGLGNPATASIETWVMDLRPEGDTVACLLIDSVSLDVHGIRRRVGVELTRNDLLYLARELNRIYDEVGPRHV